MKRDWFYAALAIHAALALLLAPALASTAGAQPQTTGMPPSAAEAGTQRERQMRELTESLAETAQKYGGDAVALQAALLMTSLSAGAVGPTEVSVVGLSPDAGAGYLRIDVQTGIVFDSDTTTAEARVSSVWKRVALPALDRLQTTTFKPAGLDLVLAYETQSYTRNPSAAADFDQEMITSHVRVTIPSEALRALVAGEIAVEDLLGRSRMVGEAPQPASP